MPVQDPKTGKFVAGQEQNPGEMMQADYSRKTQELAAARAGVQQQAQAQQQREADLRAREVGLVQQRADSGIQDPYATGRGGRDFTGGLPLSYPDQSVGREQPNTRPTMQYQPPPAPQYNWEANLGDEDYATGQHMRAMRQEMQRIADDNKRMSQELFNRQVQTERQITEARRMDALAVRHPTLDPAACEQRLASLSPAEQAEYRAMPLHQAYRLLHLEALQEGAGTPQETAQTDEHVPYAEGENLAPTDTQGPPTPISGTILTSRAAAIAEQKRLLTELGQPIR